MGRILRSKDSQVKGVLARLLLRSATISILASLVKRYPNYRYSSFVLRVRTSHTDLEAHYLPLGAACPRVLLQPSTSPRSDPKLPRDRAAAIDAGVLAYR